MQTAKTMTNVPTIEPNGKLTAWLDEHGSHDVYDLDELAAYFKEKVGVPFPPYIPRKTVQEVALMMQNDPRGGTINGDPQSRALTVSGYEMASAFASRIVNHRSTMMGRGFLYRDCVAALKKAGY